MKNNKKPGFATGYSSLKCYVMILDTLTGYLTNLQLLQRLRTASSGTGTAGWGTRPPEIFHGGGRREIARRDAAADAQRRRGGLGGGFGWRASDLCEIWRWFV